MALKVARDTFHGMMTCVLTHGNPRAPRSLGIVTRCACSGTKRRCTVVLKICCYRSLKRACCMLPWNVCLNTAVFAHSPKLFQHAGTACLGKSEQMQTC